MENTVTNEVVLAFKEIALYSIKIGYSIVLIRENNY